MGKYLVLIFFILPLQAFWYIWGFLLAWSAADSGLGKPFWQKVREELNGRSPELTELWVFATVMNACLLMAAVFILVRHFIKKYKKEKNT
jgi:hypothetical protein